MRGLPVSWSALRAVLKRVDLWPEVARLALRTAPRGWWRTWPPLPVPAADYLHFRAEAMLGADPGQRLSAEEAVGFLEWCRRFRRLTG